MAIIFGAVSNFFIADSIAAYSDGVATINKAFLSLSAITVAFLASPMAGLFAALRLAAACLCTNGCALLIVFPGITRP